MRNSHLTSAQQRSLQKREQSPDTKIGEEASNREQVQRYNLLSGDAGDQFFLKQGDEQLHHLKGLRVFDGLFANTTIEQSRALSAELGGSGNQISNQYWTPPEAHQPGVHNLNRERGLENRAAASKRHELLYELDQAADMPFEYKMHLARRFREELLPQTKNAYDDAMTAYYEGSKEAQKQARWRAVQWINSINQLPIAV